MKIKNTNDLKKLASITAKNDPIHLGLAGGVLWSIGDGRTFFRYAEEGPRVKVNRKEFLELVRLLPKGVTIDEIGEGVIKMGVMEFHFDAEPIPPSLASSLIPRSPSACMVDIDTKQLTESIKFNACADKDDSRLGLRMILYDHGTMVSTDGYRMHIIEGERTDYYFKFPPSPVLLMMGEKIRAAYQDEETIWMSDIGQVEFDALDNYKFPIWQDVMPAYSFRGPTVDAAVLAKVAEIGGGKKGKFVRLRGDMTILGQEGNVTVPHQGGDLPGMVQLQYRFLRDALELFTSPTITWGSSKGRANDSLVLIQEKGVTALIMPMYVSQDQND